MARTLAGLRRIWHSSPAGGLWAVAIIGCTHLVLRSLVFPLPVAQERVRHKVAALTSDVTPSIIVAGDSRACFQVDPAVLTRKLGVAPETGVNLGLPTCDLASVVAWYREYEDRFSCSPVMVISMSGWMVGPREGMSFDLNREYYAERGITDTHDQVGWTEAALDFFGPESTLFKRVSSWRRWTLDDRIFRRQHPGRAATMQAQRGFKGLVPRDWSPPGGSYAEYVAKSQPSGWFQESSDPETAWEHVRQDLSFLLARGVQLVVLDSPDHPDLTAYLVAGTPAGHAHARFRERLSEQCASLSIPLLRYDARDLGGSDPGELFFDGLHLDRNGAAILSEKIADDLQDLMARNVLSHSDASPPNCR